MNTHIFRCSVATFKIYKMLKKMEEETKGRTTSVVSMKSLLEAGVHFGHQTRRWSPRIAKYIFTERNGICIIDLQKTVKKIEEAYNYVREVVANSGEILFIGTEKQARDAISKEANKCGMPYINQRWLERLLTNHKTIRERIDRLEELRRMEEDETFGVLPKKEVIKLRHEAERLEKFLGGIRNMSRMPDAIYIADPKKEQIAVKEAQILGVPIIDVLDTNCDLDEVDYPIPGNDDTIRTVRLIIETMANAVIERRQELQGSEESSQEPGDGEETTEEVEA